MIVRFWFFVSYLITTVSNKWSDKLSSQSKMSKKKNGWKPRKLIMMPYFPYIAKMKKYNVCVLLTE